MQSACQKGSASPGKAGRGRCSPRASPPGGGGGEPRGEPGTRAWPPEPPRGSLRVGLPHPTALRTAGRKARAGSTIHPPTADGCGRPSLPPLLGGRVVRNAGSQETEERLLPTGSPAVWAVAPRAAIAPGAGGSQAAGLPRPHCVLPTLRAAHSAAGWVTSPFGLCPGTRPFPSSLNGLAAAVIPLVSWEKWDSFPRTSTAHICHVLQTGRKPRSRSGVTGFLRGLGA